VRGAARYDYESMRDGSFFHELFGEVYFSRGLTRFWRPSTSIHGMPNALLAQEGELTPAWAGFHRRWDLGRFPREHPSCQTRP
jgi:hypothetical protein